MGHSLTRVVIHGIFSTKAREPMIDSKWRERLHDYLGGIVRETGGPIIAVGGTDDHVHVAFGLPSDISLADFMRTLKANSSKWIGEQRFVRGKFGWQTGYGAFSVSESQLPAVVEYIRTQEEHHRKVTFAEEIRRMVELHHLKWDERFLA